MTSKASDSLPTASTVASDVPGGRVWASSTDMGSTVGGDRLARRPRSALDDDDREPAPGGLLVLHLHVATGVAHRLDRLVERDDLLAGPPQGDPRGGDGLDGRD